MKKFLSILALLLMPLLATASVIIDGICYDLNADTQEATVTSKRDPYSGDIVIPATITVDGTVYNVTSIGESAFFLCWDLTSLSIPASVTSIGEDAFFLCWNLTSLSIPANVTSIGNAFAGCSGLTSIIVDKGNTIYDSRENCNAIIETASNTLIVGCMNTTISDGVTSIGRYAFSGCKKLTSFTIPNSVTNIGEHAFSDCNALTSVTIPDGVTSIGDSAFYHCPGLTSLTIPESVTTIGESAFYNCSSLYNFCCYADSVPQTGSDIFGGSVPIQSATLYVPANSLEAYAAQEPWSQFGNIAAIQDSIIVGTELTLAEKDRYPYYPCIVVQPNANLKVEGTDLLTLNHVSLEARLNSGSYSQIMYSPESITVKGDVSERIYTQGMTWNFLSLPFDCDLSRLEVEDGTAYAIRYYDGASRAAKNAAQDNWKNYGKRDIIPMGTGFIYMTEHDAWTRFYAVDNENKAHVFQSTSGETTLGLERNEAASAKNSGWNLVGNPYANYYSIQSMDFSKAVTVWNGASYDAVFPSDDDLALKPGQAFFVQCPSGVESITLPGSGRQLTAEVTGGAKARSASARGTRRLINLSLTDSQFTDKTRVVLNEEASMGYELEHDAGKFMSMRLEVPQLYSLGTDGTKYAINERPMDDGTVRLGLYIPADGDYTLTITRNDAEQILLTDSETGQTIDLTEGSYRFYARKGTYNNRLMLTFGTVTGMDDVRWTMYDVPGGEAYYDLSGRRIGKPTRAGVYLLKNGKTVQKVWVK